MKYKTIQGINIFVIVVGLLVIASILATNTRAASGHIYELVNTASIESNTETVVIEVAVQVDGWYLINAGGILASTFDGRAGYFLNINGVKRYNPLEDFYANKAPFGKSFNRELKAGSIVQLVVYQNSGSAMNINHIYLQLTRME